ncbi:MAG TPA: PQQ-binding-like beta-propeller repeat protein [Steroidobacteraceae bacterium]|nr:PQQ-binding-like beta-propeller repeat protein [Steroidobacteraceae bacterium]
MRAGAIAGLAIAAVAWAGWALSAEPAPQGNGLTPGTEVGFGIFQQNCLSCHGQPAYPQAPSPAQLRSYSPERIFAALSSGAMQAVGMKLSDVQKRLVAQAVAGRLLGSSAQGDAKSMQNRCRANPPLGDAARSGQWWGWGNGIDNTRFQSARAAGLTAAQVPQLQLRWAFGLPNSTSAYSQPTVSDGRVFIGTDTGFVYSVDARSGCVYWSYAADSAVRNAPIVEPIHGHAGAHEALYFGDLKANVYALDAHTGALLWKTHIDPQYTTRVTATPAYYAGRLYVPISSWEEFSARSLDYPCCTAVGNVVALDANSGRQLWKSYVIAQRPHPVRKNSHGVQQYAPAGGSVWNTPAVDPQRHAIYFGTGDGTTYPAPDSIDAVMAVDMRTGHRLWSFEATHGDSFLVGCRGDNLTDNCPQTEGPDWDIPVSPILVRLRNGHRLVVVATKPGDVLALDPDAHGRLVWRMNVSGRLAGDVLPPGGHYSGMMWGGAVLGETVYYGLTGGGLAAIDLASGALRWKQALAPAGERISDASPVTAIPGVLFVGGADGHLFGVAARDGQVLWSFDTARQFDTVNGVAAHGGGISSQGFAVVDGMLFAGSGYSVTSAHPGNVLLAFGVGPPAP